MTELPVSPKETRKPKRIDWMDPLNKIVWRNAFIRKDRNVTLRDGRRFRIEYNIRPGEPDLVWVSPDPLATTQKVPCGWFNYKEIAKNGSWVSSSG